VCKLGLVVVRAGVPAVGDQQQQAPAPLATPASDAALDRHLLRWEQECSGANAGRVSSI